MPDTAIDDYVDQFDLMDQPTQERVMDSLRLVQRLAKRRAQRTEAPQIISVRVNETVNETAEAHDARLDRQMAEQAEQDSIADGTVYAEIGVAQFGADHRPKINLSGRKFK